MGYLTLSIGTIFTMRLYAVSAQQSTRDEFTHRVEIISDASKYTVSPSFNILCSRYMKIGLERRIQSIFTCAVQENFQKGSKSPE